MRVAMYYNNKDVRLEVMPMPELGEGEILVKVLASGICGTDVLEWYRVKNVPRVLGHEIAGEIAKVGSEGIRYKIGDRVFVSHHIPCNRCRYCLNGHHTACDTLHTTNYYPGGFSEYIRVPKPNVESGVFLLPDEMSYEEATFIEPLACTVRGQRIAGFRPGMNVLVLGSGISGLLHILLARARGAEKITATDVNDYRLKQAKRFGAGEVIDGRSDLSGVHADLVIVCTGAPSAFKQALEAVDRGGTILFFATTQPGVELAVPIERFWRSEIKMVTSYANAPDDAAEAIELIRSGQIPVRGLITHRLKLSEAALGFRLVAEGKESLKVIIEPYKS